MHFAPNCKCYSADGKCSHALAPKVGVFRRRPACIILEPLRDPRAPAGCDLKQPLRNPVHVVGRAFPAAPPVPDYRQPPRERREGPRRHDAVAPSPHYAPPAASPPSSSDDLLGAFLVAGLVAQVTTKSEDPPVVQSGGGGDFDGGGATSSWDDAAAPTDSPASDSGSSSCSASDT